MHKLTNWTARRAGPGIAVSGTGETGRRVKLSGLDVVTVEGSPHVIAAEGPFRAQQAGRDAPVRVHLITPAHEALTAVVRELIFGDGTDASLQRTLDLCNEARSRFGIERPA